MYHYGVGGYPLQGIVGEFLMDRMAQARRRGLRHLLCLFAMLAATAMMPGAAQAHLQCVPYAREVSGIAIHGDAHLWWARAEGQYQRGDEPRVGAVLAFRSTSAMPLGHVAVVREIVDDRRVILDHANWSGPGVVERHALAEDVSPAGDWSAVRVWYAPIDALGARTNPTYGFIYNEPAAAADGVVLAAGDADDRAAGG